MKPEPLDRFQDLLFSGTVTFLNEHYEPRSTDGDIGLRLNVQLLASGDSYQLTGKFFKDQGHVRRFAVTGNDVLDVMVTCAMGTRSTTIQLPLCGLVHSVERQQLQELLPLGETRRLAANRQWTLETQVEMVGATDGDETFPLQLHIEHQGPTFYMRRLSLQLPRQHCDAWFQQACLAVRQAAAGVCAKTQ